MKFWKTEMAPAPIDLDLIARFQATQGIEFPLSFRENMARRNGGIVRTGAFHWWLFPFPGNGHTFPAKNMWLGSEVPDLPTFMNKAKQFTTFPENAVPFGLRLFTGSADGVLCFLRSAEAPDQLMDEVWVWHWYKKPMGRLLERSEQLWRDDPFRVPKPKQNWKAKRQKLVRSPDLAACSRGSKGTADEPKDLGWVNVYTLSLIGRRIAITDGAGSDFEEALCVPMESGAHQLSARILGFGKNRRIGCIRLLAAERSWSQCVRVGSVDVDLGSILLSDVDPILTCEEMVLDELSDRLMDLILIEKQFGLLSFGPTTMIQVASGLGDGTYEVFQLLDGELPVGAEVRFIEPVA